MESSNYEDSSSNEPETYVDTDVGTSNSHAKKKHRRHSQDQIQKLEEFYGEYRHPDELQRRQLAEQLNLNPKQIKFWFQNRRNQEKCLIEKTENEKLRKENTKLKLENGAMQDALKNLICPPCRGFGSEEQMIILQRLQQLRAEHAFLNGQRERLANIIVQHGGVEVLTNILGQSTYGSTSNNPLPSYGASSNILHHQPPSSSMLRGPYGRVNNNTTPPPKRAKQLLPHHFPPLSQMEKMMMFEMGTKAVEEVMILIMEEVMWKKSSMDDRVVINPDNYEKRFPKVSHFKGSFSRPESSKEVVVVQMEASNLVQMFLDTEKWTRLFPKIVSEAKTIYELDSVDNNGKQTFSRVIYEQLHILSPMVPPREFIILRTCQEIEENLWMIADVSCKLPNFDDSMLCTKYPSGVLIQALPDGSSKVTWIEHVEITDKMRPNKLYRDLFLYGGFGYGARRWTITLQTMCERLNLSSLSDFSNNDYPGVVQTIEGRRSVMKLGERMLKDFASILNMDDQTVGLSQMSETKNSGIRISTRPNQVPGQPPTGFIFRACLSLCLPLPPLQVYDFLRNFELRHQWDVHCREPMNEVARFVTGTDPKNYVNFLQPSREEDNRRLGWILQDASINELGGTVVYTPMDSNDALAAMSGQEDPSNIPIFPSGFIISRDGENHNGLSTILTVALQIPFSLPRTPTDLQDSATAIDNLTSSTIQRIKARLNCQ